MNLQQIADEKQAGITSRLARMVNIILAKIKDSPEVTGTYNDLLTVCKEMEPEDKTYAHAVNAELRNLIVSAMKKGVSSVELFPIYKASLLFDARDSLDAYLLYVELGRDPRERFYQPRRKVLKQVVDALQKLADGDLQELFLSCPPRIGKSSLMAFYISWLIGRDPEKPNLYSSFSDTITRSFYNAVIEILTDVDTYAWNDVFPYSKIASTNAADETINIDRRRHYPSLTARSIDGTLNGACDASGGCIIADDLVSGIEEAMNKERLISKWGKVDNNLIPRGKPNTRYLWIGTRWSVLDPAGIRIDLLENDPKYAGRKYEIINLPALNENDESNFDYPYGVGFDTLYYQQRRASFERNNDMASWFAQYMGQPIEREGTLFTPNDFRYYNGELPEGMPDRVFMAVDPAYGGGDFVAAPVCVQYGEDVYIPAVVYDNGDKKVTQPMVAKKAQQYNVSVLQIEGDKSTAAYREGVTDELRKIGYKCTLTSRNSASQKNKQQRIFDKAPDIREHMIFLEPGKRTKEYTKFMENVFAFKIYLSKSGLKKQHDDAPDSLGQAIDMVVHPTGRFHVFQRPF